ncbi:MAG: molybdopterin dinucleotide binding domain-containing protein [Acidobacteriota bacterium]|nr:formylmethanofuran dehydrogenase [Acidobacteriota bacterium]
MGKAPSLVLITGRSTAQGKFLHLGKDSEEFQEEVLRVNMNAEDMARRGLEGGAEVRVRSAHGEMKGRCVQADLPEGLVFIPYSVYCNQLIGGDTEGSGMPDSKGLQVEVEEA